MYKKLIVFALVMALAGSASALFVDYAIIDFDRSGTQGTNETRIGDATARYSPWTIDTTSLTGDDYSITISASPGDNKFEFDDSGDSPAGAPFTATQKQGFVQRDGSADTVHIAFTGLAPGNYTLDAAAGADTDSRWPIWSTTTGASVTDLTGTANGTAVIQAAWSFTVTSEAGDQITINAASAGETSRGKVAAMTLTYIPEPATIMLLGLGGLALLRRKR